MDRWANRAPAFPLDPPRPVHHHACELSVEGKI